MVADLRPFNTLQPDFNFRLPSLVDITRNWVRGAYWMVIDFEKGFYHVPLHPNVRRYVCFRFNRRLYRYLRLPMGAKLSPAFFCWLSGEMTRILQELGINVVIVYVDDLLIRAASEEAAEEALAVLEAVFCTANASIKASKVQGPAQDVQVIGAVVDSASDTLRIAPSKQYRTLVELAALRHVIEHGISTGAPTFVPLQWVRSVVGSVE